MKVVVGMRGAPRARPLFIWERSGHATAPERLAGRTIAGVMRNAQAGELPLFAWTLGLSQADLLSVVDSYFPELGALAPIAEAQYAVLCRDVPPFFGDMVALLVGHRVADADRRQGEWLARAVAAAAMGERHLWQDVGLASRDELSAMLAHHFPTLYARNTQQMTWKRFLFKELGEALAIPDLRPPGCRQCEQFALCFHGYKG